MTKGAIVNLCNRYRAVLKKCHVNNMLAKLFITGTIVLAVPPLAEAGENIQNITDKNGKDSVGFVVGPDITTGNATAEGVEITVNHSTVYGKINGININLPSGTVSDNIYAKSSTISVLSDSSVGRMFVGQKLKTTSGSASALTSINSISDSSIGDYVEGQHVNVFSRLKFSCLSL